MAAARQFRIGRFSYDYNNGKVCDGQSHTILRAKSNDVLYYLLQHPKQIQSKQSILSTIWDDVSAQEHVLFQSIKEIRQCFQGMEVIKTHPRKGYEWIAESVEEQSVVNQSVEPVNNNSMSRSARFMWSITAAVATVLILFLALFVFTPQHSDITAEATSANPPPKFVELVVTPVKITEQDNLLHWVPIGAMDMLIQKLQQTPIEKSSGHIMVVDTEDVLEALQRSGSRHQSDEALQSRQLRHAMGEITSLHTELFGSPMEYTLRYSLISRHNTQQGILSGDNVVTLLNQLAKRIPELLQMNTSAPYVAYEQRFADDAFIFGLSHFYQGSFELAEDYFVTAINSGDSYPQSRRYLAKAIAAQGDIPKALAAAQEAVNYAQQHSDNSELLRSQFELGVAQWHNGDWHQAKNNITATQQMAQSGKDLLYLAFAIEMLGHLAFQEQQFEDAEHYYHQAIRYHQGFQCPYGLSTNYINLAKLKNQQQHNEQAKDYFNQALSVAQQNELGYFETRIQLLLARSAQENAQTESVQNHLLAVQNLLQKYPSDGVQQIVNNWPDSLNKIR